MLLYIHIPFCDSKCGYCAFKSFDNQFYLKNQYLKALNTDLKHTIDRLNNIQYLDSIYIGGGTPNVLLPKDYESIFLFLKKYINKNTEITMELNPNNSDSALLKDFVNLGINRFSIGVQSFYRNKLQLLQRMHNPKKAIKFIENAMKCGIENISIDLIYDTSLDTKTSLMQELDIANSLEIGHISCYSLSIDEDSKFYDFNISPLIDDSLCYELKDKLQSLGFNQYETSNFYKKSKSKHNLAYWQYEEYLGVGLSAVGRIGCNRMYKSNYLIEYINNPISLELESLSIEDMSLERLFLGLRSEVGVNVNDIYNKDILNYLLDSRNLYDIDSRIYSSNYFLADEYAIRLSKN